MALSGSISWFALGCCNDSCFIDNVTAITSSWSTSMQDATGSTTAPVGRV
eukprot:CAMPEP_0178468644 /NCGR_PEP_ID=MMETSP0689_2-20121128/53023_1 /TAXON_ID=160604 /ORGANISM="Amphidinium massartii, Strain CS-259" /LENGTH=49 /DNA_ID=CAMNT_0020095701 /DNA_START=267 /DNA_END=416 /DNA_ORIENTATION=-